MNSPDNSSQDRPRRVLWANCFCMLDTSSGASITVRRMLAQLAKRGIEVRALGASIFDAPHGKAVFAEKRAQYGKRRAPMIEFDDEAVRHTVVLTRMSKRNGMTVAEEFRWYTEYTRLLDSFRPDIVMTYGGLPLDILATQEARRRGIPVAAYLANGNYKGTNWCRDIDLILTDSEVTRNYYRDQEGFEPQCIGKFIMPEDVVAEHKTRERVLFVNPSLAKGAAIVAALAAYLEQSRPDIEFEIVEARGNWAMACRAARRLMPGGPAPLKNVTVTPNTMDMRPVYGRARLLLVPSLWWESGSRVAVEAALNGLPVIAVNRGGPPEMLGGEGFLFDFPEECHRAPYTALPPRSTIAEMAATIERLYDDQEFYHDCATRIRDMARRKHDVETNTDRLLACLQPLLDLRAGDEDFAENLRKAHKHGETIKRAV
jgi:glycosyltransferase involved in cell wall biosynthesis